MRKSFICLLVCCLFFASCTKKEKTYHIGVSQCSGGIWRNKVNKEMLAAQHLYEWNVKVDIVEAGDNPERQVQQIDSFTHSDIDLLLVAPSDAKPLVPAIERAQKAGIPVICFDRKAATEHYTAFIGCDNVQAGRDVGNYVALKMKDEPRPIVLEVVGSMQTSPAQERHKGFSEVMKQHPELDYQWVEGAWAHDVITRVMKDFLKSSALPDIIFCHNDGMAYDVSQILKEAKLEKSPLIIGFDGLPGKGEGMERVQKGLFAATYIYPTHGEKIVRLALDILTGKEYKRNNILTGTMVTPENVDMLLQSGNELMSQTENLVTINDKLEDSFSLLNTQQRALLISIIGLVVLFLSLALAWRAAREMRRANRKMQSLNEEQTLFYTNASHQLRTPLTLIAGPVKQLIDSHVLKDKQQELLEVVERNVTQLETVISSVLNFKKNMSGMTSDDNANANANASANADLLKESRVNLLKQDDMEELATLLVVDDNDDMRRYLHTLLADRFYVLEAPDGQSGLRLARESVPDIVVSDVMMPVMDGLQFCKHLKEDAITSHIPVILLTARSSESQQIEGFEHGADAYITKPFHADLLVARIYNLLNNRKKLSQLLGEKQKEEVQLNTQDRIFTDALKGAIRKKMANPSLKMDELGEELGYSRVQLYRKVKALTGLSPVELLRQIRLQQGYNLICTTNKTISEVAFEVGFATPSYFSRCFKQQYGKYPMDLRENE